jgi:tetratricopeptide (TPR) repeat protein
LAREYIRADDPDGAERVLDRLIDAGAGDANAYRLRSGARFQKEDWRGAYTDARTALNLNPRDTVAAELAGTSKMQLQRLGIKAPEVKQGKLREEDQPAPREEAARAPQGGEELGGSGVVPLFGKAEPGADPRLAFFAAIDRKVAIGGRQEAFLGLTRYLDLNPDDATALTKRANLLNHNRNPKAALADSEKALAAAPADPAAMREKAYALIQLGNPGDALRLLERAIRLQPKNGLGYLYRAMSRSALGEKQDALADYRRAAELDPALQSYFDAALAELGGAPKKGGGAAANWKVRGAVAAVALTLLLAGLWNGLRARSGRTTRGPAGPAGAEEVAAPLAPAETLVAGNVLGGLYQVGRVLGRGGMGVVFEAWDQGLERKVAIKQLRTPDGAPEDYERFLKEARLVARLQHPNIVQIHTLVEDGGLLYLVFELVDGRPLDSVLGERSRLTPPEALDVVRDVCAALDCAHESRIIHRDLKPSNIMMTSKGDFKVMDFGIAHQAQSDVMMTQTGAWGTPPYMAPEQERGVVSRESDLFALACTVYELLTGGRPFGPGADKTRPTYKPISSLASGLTPQADAFMARALAGDPAQRFHSGAEFAAAFAACLNGRIAA